jgi:hypothetical protein
LSIACTPITYSFVVKKQPARHSGSALKLTATCGLVLSMYKQYRHRYNKSTAKNYLFCGRPTGLRFAKNDLHDFSVKNKQLPIFLASIFCLET